MLAHRPLCVCTLAEYRQSGGYGERIDALNNHLCLDKPVFLDDFVVYLALQLQYGLIQRVVQV